MSEQHQTLVDPATGHSPSTAQTASRKKKKKTQRVVGGHYLGKRLGQGATALAHLGIDVSTGEKVALKFLFDVKSDASKEKAVRQEMKTLEKVVHENVVRFINANWSGQYPHKNGSKSDCAVITLELCENGELFDYLFHTGAFSDTVARTYFRQLVEGVSACHERGVVHRDLKPQNLLLDKDFILKIADFGFAVAQKSESDDMTTAVGTPGFMAPEVRDAQVTGAGYGRECDVWSCGVILFILFAGYPPYESQGDWWHKRLMADDHKMFWRGHEQMRQDFSPEFKDLINKLLTKDANKRITLAQVKKHPWYIKDVLSREDLKKEFTRRKGGINPEEGQAGLEAKNDSVNFAQGMRSPTGGSALRAGRVPKLPSMLLPLDTKSLPKPEAYDPAVRSYTTAETKIDPKKALQYVVTLLKGMEGAVKFERDGYEIVGTVQAGTGPINFNVSTYARREGKDGAVVEFTRNNGSLFGFRKFYKYVGDALNDV